MRYTILGWTLSVLAAPGLVQAQAPGPTGEVSPGDPSPVDAESPQVESVVFEGVEAIDADVLADSIATKETRCRGFLLIPFCAVTDAGAFVEKHYLDREELPLDELRIRVIYFRRGYRQARVESTLTPEGEGVAVTFVVDEGPLTRIDVLAVTQADPVLPPDAIDDARLPREGGPLDLTLLDSATIRLRNDLWDRGYADAVVEHAAEIDTATHTAVLRVRIEPGRVTTIGEVVVEGSEEVTESTIRTLFGLRPGQVYRRTDMTRAQRRLYETELFRQALVSVPETEDTAKTVVISVREAPPRSLRAGPGFNTVEFLQAEARFTRYNFLGAARRLDTRVAVGNLLAPQLYGRSIFGSAEPDGIGEDVAAVYLDPTWYAGIDLTQPTFLSSRNSVGIGVSAHRRSIPGIVVDRGVTVHGSFTRRMAEGLSLSLAYRFEETRIRAGDVYFCVSFGVCDPPTIAALHRPHHLAPLEIQGRMERTDDPLAPTTGYVASLHAEHASAATLSDFQHQRVSGEASRYLGLGTGVLAGRVRAGWVRATEGTTEVFGLSEDALELLHPRRRFLAGGARSVRGYGENQLGPRVFTIPAQGLIRPADSTGIPACTRESIADATCDPNVADRGAFQSRPLGGHTLLEGSIEYRHPITPTLAGAVFVDAGTLRGSRVNFPPGSRSAITPGFGIRYHSPIGPVRLDVGVRTSGMEEVPVVTEMEGPDGEVRLVQLEHLLRYDPVGDSSNFLSGILSRLQLHLAIGEAF